MTFYLILAFWPHKVTWTNNYAEILDFQDCSSQMWVVAFAALCCWNHTTNLRKISYFC